MVRVKRLLLHKGNANNVLPNTFAYHSVPRYGYCLSCTVPCGVYRDTPVYRSDPSYSQTESHKHLYILRVFIQHDN